VSTFTITVNPEPGLVLYRINAGGPEVMATDGGPNWAVDTDAAPSSLHNAGTTASDWGAVPTVDISVPSTTPNAIFMDERWDNGSEGDPLADEMQWIFPVLSGTQVELRLYLRDGYFGTTNPGDRVFDIAIDGNVVQDDYDIIADAGDDTGTMKSYLVTSDGSINLDFLHVEENPTVNGIEILIPDPDAAQLLYRINAGGTAVTGVSGPTWWDDSGSPSPYHNDVSTTGGFPNDNGVDASVPPTTPTSVFVTERFDFGAPGDPAADEMQWDFSVANGQWVEVRLYFHNGYDGTSTPGTRQFDVVLEGNTVLDDYDIVVDVGHRVGVMKSFTVQSDGNIDIDFFHVVENPLVNAIEIYKVAAP
jgi:hypothetical protein